MKIALLLASLLGLLGAGGFGTAPNFSVVSFAAVPSAIGPAPLVTGYDVCVDSTDGRPPEQLTFVITCANGSKVTSQVGTDGDVVDDNTTCYHFNTPTCVDAVDGTAEVRVLWKGRDVNKSATTAITVESSSAPSIMLADIWPTPAPAPASDLEAGILAPGGTAPVHAYGDQDFTCSPTAAVTDACFETDWGVLAGNGLLSPIALPDQTPGQKTLRFAVRDAAGAGATSSLSYAITGPTLACDLTLANASGASPLSNVRPTVACTGSGIDDPCDLRICATRACTSASESTIYSNTFDSAGCALATATDPPFACPIDPDPDGPGGDTTAAQVGQTAGGTQFMRFDNAFPNSAAALKVEVGWRFTTEGTFTQNRVVTLRNGGTESGYYVNRGSASSDTLCLYAGGGNCCAANAYVVGDWNSRFTIDILSTATGQARLLDETGTPLCTVQPTGTGPFPADGFSLNPSNNIVEFAYLNAIVPTPGAGVVFVDENTTWPYDLWAEQAIDFDNYTSDQTVIASVTCPNVEAQNLEAAVDVNVVVPFLVTNVTAPTSSCTQPDCAINSLLAAYSGGTGTVTGVTVQVGAGTTPIAVPGTFTSSPIQLIGPGLMPPIVFEDDDQGTVAITVTMTSGSVTQSNALSFLVNPAPVGNDQLVCSPVNSTEIAAPGASPPADSFTVTTQDGSVRPFTCIENEPAMTLESCCEITPATIARTYSTATLPAGTRRPAPIKCCDDTDPANCATCTPVIEISSPTPGDPAFILDRVNGQARIDPNYGYPPGVTCGASGIQTFGAEMKNAKGHSMQIDDDGFANSVTKNVLVWNLTADSLNGLPESSQCVPASTCGDTENGCGNRDAMHFPWPQYRSQYTFAKWLTAKNAWHTCPHSCPPPPAKCNNPHDDGIQGWGGSVGGGSCPYKQFLLADSESYNVDDAQAILFTSHKEGANESPAVACDLETWTLHNVRVGPNNAAYATACEYRDANTVESAGWNCRGNNNQMPSTGGDGDDWQIWIIGGSGQVHVGSGINHPQPLIVVATDPARIRTPNKVVYANVETALTTEFGLGRKIPCFLGYQATGWASPPAKATPTGQRGDQH